MKVLAFAVLLTVMQAAPAAPRQAPSVGAQSRDQAVEAKHDHDSVTIRELPSVSIKSGWTDYVALCFTGALLLVGIAGVWAAYRTLRVLESQTLALVEGQRPKIEIKPHNDVKVTISLMHCYVELEMHNRGQTMANNVAYESWLELLPEPFIDFTKAVDHVDFGETFGLPPNGAPMIMNLPIRPRVTNEQLGRLRTSQLFVCIRIHVRYSDAFKPIRNVEFGYRLISEGMTPLPKYNRGEY
jgi:hypothetical protein